MDIIILWSMLVIQDLKETLCLQCTAARSRIYFSRCFRNNDSSFCTDDGIRLIAVQMYHIRSLRTVNFFIYVLSRRLSNVPTEMWVPVLMIVFLAAVVLRNEQEQRLYQFKIMRIILKVQHWWFVSGKCRVENGPKNSGSMVVERSSQIGVTLILSTLWMPSLSTF